MLGLDAALLLLRRPPEPVRRPLMSGYACVVGSLYADGPNQGGGFTAVRVENDADERSVCADEAVEEKQGAVVLSLAEGEKRWRWVLVSLAEPSRAARERGASRRVWNFGRVARESAHPRAAC